MKSINRISCLAAFCVTLLYSSSVNSASTVGVIGGKGKVTYDIPSSFSAGDELITKFKAVSSHGRADDADGATAVTYTSFQVATRALYLIAVFAPMFFTTGLAYISRWYRNGVWFSLLRFGISQGGAVSFDCRCSAGHFECTILSFQRGQTDAI